MTISAGDRMPEGTVVRMNADGPKELDVAELFEDKKIVLFSVPGAFTPTCSKKHLPGYIDNANAIKQKGIDTIACLAVNDIHVMHAWGKSVGADDSVIMLADGNCAYTAALGMELDLFGANMGRRGKRFSALIDDGIVIFLNLEPPREFGISSAETLLEQLL
jgi:glutaredoxin/glutathione-dependent peroxiredoxin